MTFVLTRMNLFRISLLLKNATPNNIYLSLYFVFMDSPLSHEKMETPEYSAAIQALMDQDVSTQQEILDLFVAKKISP